MQTRIQKVDHHNIGIVLLIKNAKVTVMSLELTPENFPEVCIEWKILVNQLTSIIIITWEYESLWGCVLNSIKASYPHPINHCKIDIKMEWVITAKGLNNFRTHRVL